MARQELNRDSRLLLATQQHLAGSTSLHVARALSSSAEHARVWLALAALGAVCDPARRGSWMRVGLSALTAHAAAVVLKRVVRRPRPDLEGLTVHGATHSALSFPSAHAASTTAAALALLPLAGPAVLAAPPAMALARVRLGVHYPSDVLVGAALGALVAFCAAPS